MGALQGDAVGDGFRRAMDALGLAPDQPLAVAYSGGGDSTALLALALRHTQDAPVRALIVDHGLRPESAAEARQAAHMASTLGARPRIMRWADPAPGQARARAARYRLLAQGCREAGLDHVLLAHTRDDQEETFALRLARGSSERGLACMSLRAPLPLWPQGRALTLARPLLSVGRAQLRHWLHSQGLAWIEDPSNCNRAYERVRVRRHLAALHAHGLPRGRIAASVRRLGALERARRRASTAVLEQAVQWQQAGYAIVHLEEFAQGQEDVLACVLGAVLAGVSGTGLPALSHFKALQLARQLASGALLTRSLAGCRVHSDGAHVLVSRDAGAVLGRGGKAHGGLSASTVGEEVVFDGRFAMNAAQGAALSALGGDAAHLPASQRQALKALPDAVRCTVPVMADGAGGLVSPVLGGACQAQFLGREIALRLLAPFSQGCT